MPNWTENEYVEQAKDLARRHVTTNKTINDLAEKVAKEQTLSPDEIRTLVRMTNVQVFQEKFAAMAGDHKMVEFETGDPEAVIQRIHQEAAPTQSANIHNDKLASEIPDFMYEIRTGVSKSFEEKVAQVIEQDPVPLPRKDKLIMATEKLAEEFRVEKEISEQRWSDRLTKLANLFKRAPGYGKDLISFTKEAWATFGDEAHSELYGVYQLLKKDYTLADQYKVADYKNNLLVENSPELELLKEAVDEHMKYAKYVLAIKFLEEKLKVL
jgi:hypothetical protein